MDRHQRGDTHSFNKQLPHTMTGCFRCDHRHVYGHGRRNLPKVDVESVSEHQRLASRKMRLDVAFVEIALDVIGDQDHHCVSGLSGFAG